MFEIGLLDIDEMYGIMTFQHSIPERTVLDEKVSSVSRPVFECMSNFASNSMFPNRNVVILESKGSWFSFVLGGVVSGIGVLILPFSPTTGAVVIGAGVSLMTGAIAQTVNEELNENPSPRERDISGEKEEETH